MHDCSMLCLHCPDGACNKGKLVPEDNFLRGYLLPHQSFEFGSAHKACVHIAQMHLNVKGNLISRSFWLPVSAGLLYLLVVI